MTVPTVVSALEAATRQQRNAQITNILTNYQHPNKFTPQKNFNSKVNTNYVIASCFGVALFPDHTLPVCMPGNEAN